MAGTDDLISGPPEGVVEKTRPRPSASADPAEILEPDRTPQRATIYWVLLLVLLAGTLILRGSPWDSGRELHILLETTSTILATVVGALALVRFYSKKRGTYLFIGTGFLGTALLEGYHSVISSGLFEGRTPVELEDVTAWSWLGARLFLSLFLYVSWLAWRREQWEGEAAEVKESSVYLTALLLTGMMLAFLTFVPTSRAYYPELSVHRPAEYLPAVLFLLALGGYLLKGTWRRDPFEHWLIIALILNVAGQAAYMPFSANLHDAAYDAAHLLKVVSYAAVLTGVMVSVYVTFRREDEAMEQVRTANDALAREVADQRRAERILQESEERLQDFLDNANDLIQSTAPDGTLLYVNRAWTRALGYEESEAVGRKMSEFVHPRSRDRCQHQIEQVLEGEDLSGIELEFVAADGRTIICSGSMNCRFEDGKPVAIRSIFRDVTEQREAERAIATSRANLEALVESTGDAIWSVDRDHRLITFNTSFALSMEARTGREPQKGDSPAKVFRPEEVGWFREQYERALSGERFSVLRTDDFEGRAQHMEYFFNPIVEEEGLNGVVAFGRDVTRRIQAEEATRLAKEEAEAANRAKTHFLANMSHELRTPLNSVIGFTNILLKNQEDNLNDKQITFLERVLSNGRHLLQLINEVLDLAKVEAGRMELEIEEVDLDEMVRETLAQLEGQVRAKKGDRVELRPEVPDGLETLETDRAKLKQVIINLVGNALKFTEDGEVAVIVEAGGNGNKARAIHVRDTGIGIPEDRLEAIFEAFQQADSSTSRKYGGTGLGLTISRSICQMLGYDMDVSSEVGEGSTFSILLGPDRAEAEIDDEAPQAEEEEPGGEEDEEEETRDVVVGPPHSAVRGFKVLVIDDEADSRVLMTHFLRDFGCDVVTAASAEEGLAMAREESPDLITLDLMMPEVDGWETLRTLKEDPELRDIPVVVVSIVAAENRGSLLGAVDLVNKPVEREDLLRVLWRNLLRKQGGRVLVVEDDPDARTLFRDFLEDAGLEVVTAENGADALQVIGRESPDAIVLDLMMPVMDGLTFLEKLRERSEYVGIPVIVVTAKDLDEEETEILQDHASGVVSKGDEDVEGRLREYLGTIVQLQEHDAGA